MRVQEEHMRTPPNHAKRPSLREVRNTCRNAAEIRPHAGRITTDVFDVRSGQSEAGFVEHPGDDPLVAAGEGIADQIEGLRDRK